jgi:hypothetical protein
MPSRRRFGATLVALAIGVPLSVSTSARADDSPARTDGPPLPDEYFTHLLKVVDERGTKISLPPSVAAALQLKPGGAHTATQVAFEETGGAKHGFARLDDGSGYFMFSRPVAAAVTVFSVSPELKLVRAAGELGRDRLIGLSQAEGQRRLAEEFAAWETVLAAKRPSPWDDKPVLGPNDLPNLPKRKLKGVTDK